MPRGCLLDASRRATAHEIAHGFVTGVGNPDRRQFSGTVKFGEHEGVAPIGFDPVTRAAWDARRSDDDAHVPGVDDLAIEAIAARPGLVTAMKLDIGLGEFFEQGDDGFGVLLIAP